MVQAALSCSRSRTSVTHCDLGQSTAGPPPRLLWVTPRGSKVQGGSGLGFSFLQHYQPWQIFESRLPRMGRGCLVAAGGVPGIGIRGGPCCTVLGAVGSSLY